MTSLMDRQIELEAEMQGLGIKRFHDLVARARRDGDESGTAYGVRLLKAAIDPTATAITAFIEEATTGKAGRKHSAVTFLSQVEPEVAAFICAKSVLDHVVIGSTLQSSALKVGARLEDELRFRIFEHKAKPLWKKLQDSIKSDHARHRRQVLVHSMRKAGIEWVDWTRKDKLLVGTKLIELFIEATGLAAIEYRNSGKNNTAINITATDDTMEWIKGRIEACELLNPTFMPTLVPPVPWTNPYNGGYHTTAVHPLTLVKTSNVNYLEELHNRVDEMPAVYGAVNALQDTAWKINTDVLTVMDAVWMKGLTIAGTPQAEREELPARVVAKDVRFADMSDIQQEKFRGWKRRAAAIYDFNARLVARRMQLAKIISVAKKFEDEQAIYFPHTLDFRGRVYAVPLFLNPQGCDQAKGLLTFSEGQPIDDEVAAGWLAIHGANLFGVDKVSFDERLAWIEENQDAILGYASDPLANIEWAEADKPWQFLAFCFEWAAFLRHGYGYVSHLPVAMDGACNGIQNFSAALRDSVGGKATNLLPSEEPEDIYQRVADVVNEKLAKLCRDYMRPDREYHDTTEVLMAQRWLSFCIDRKTTKRSVMVLPYGGTMYSCRTFLEDWHRDKVEEGATPICPEDQQFDYFVFLAKMVWDSIGEVVIAARDAMAWLQQSAREASKVGLPIVWTAPSGLPVMQAYPELKSRRVKTKFGDSVIRLTVCEEGKELDGRRQANGIAPNWVHSLDASHLCMSIWIGSEHGVKSWAMVHDSYGTHAASVEVMQQALRVAFVEMYRDHDVMEEFRQQVGAMLPGGPSDLPDLPAKGDLDIMQVLESDFFFA